MQALRISLVQGDTRWHDPGSNRTYYGNLVRDLTGQTDLAVLPETFLTGFTNDTASQAQAMNGASLDWLRDLAARTGIVITGSLIVREGNSVYNRLLWVRPDGVCDWYDKRHLFRMAGEHEHFASGRGHLTVELKGWRIRPLVCYDLRFPVWARNRPHNGELEYDVLLFVANWPAPRREAWRTLLRARAIENLSYSVGLNRVGTDGNGLAYAGDSCVIDPLGQPIVELDDRAQTATLTLESNRLLDHRQNFPAWRDADRFELWD